MCLNNWCSSGFQLPNEESSCCICLQQPHDDRSGRSSERKHRPARVRVVCTAQSRQVIHYACLLVHRPENPHVQLLPEVDHLRPVHNESLPGGPQWGEQTQDTDQQLLVRVHTQQPPPSVSNVSPTHVSHQELHDFALICFVLYFSHLFWCYMLIYIYQLWMQSELSVMIQLI